MSLQPAAQFEHPAGRIEHPSAELIQQSPVARLQGAIFNRRVGGTGRPFQPLRRRYLAAHTVISMRLPSGSNTTLS